jgi:tetratricopeptide (TPR) repeat protein
LFSAVGEIPLRKGHLVLQFREYEEALQLFDLAAQKFRTLLKTDKKHYFDTIEKRLAEVARCRAEALEHLGRYNEANQAIDEMQKILHKTLETTETSKVARAEKDKNRPFADLFQPSKQKEKKSNSNFRKNKKKQLTEEDIETQTYARITAKHNDAVADCRRGNIELQRGHWRTALKFFLKSRHIIDAPLFCNLPDAQTNLCTVYAGIANAYCNLDRYDESERWYNKAVAQFQKMINEGKLELQPTFFETLSGQAVLFAKQNNYEEAIRLYEKIYNERNRLVAENLEGLNVEHLRTHDSQRLAFSALLLQTQNQTIRAIQEKLCALDRIEDAIIWGQCELDTFEQFLRLIPDPSLAVYDQCVAKISYATLLLLGKRYEEVDALLETCEQTFLEHRRTDNKCKHDHDNNGKDEVSLTESVKQQIDQLVFIRLFDLVGDKYYNIKKMFSEVFDLYRQNKGNETTKTLELLRELIRKQQIETQNEHRLIQMFWKELEKMIDLNLELDQKDLLEWVDKTVLTSPFDLPGSKTNTIIEPEENSEELDQELTQYEKDFGGEESNNDFLYQMLDEMTGNSTASDMMRKYNEGRFQVAETGQPFHNEKTVGRNDPCPCGSGKKYKKCCMEKK